MRFFTKLAFFVLLLSGVIQALAGTRVLVFGDSLSAGHGIPKEAAWPALLKELAGDTYTELEVENSGISGDTTSSGLRRLPRSLARHFDIMILELGANDGLNAMDPQEIRANLQEIIEQVRQKYPEVILIIAGMTMPQELGQEYVQEFEAIFPELANKYHAHLIPFLLEGVAGIPNLNLEDGLHPNERGHQIIARTVWPYLERALADSRKANPDP